MASRIASTSETTAQDATRPPSSGSRLLLVTGEGLLSSYELDERDLIIGRSEECDVRIDHRALSRRHAVVHAGTPATVADLGSTNGTRIAGAVHRGGEPVDLDVGDSFQIGPFSFLLASRGTVRERSMTGRDILRVVDPTPDGVPRIVAEVAATRANVLILGETGCGKEVLAETVHVLSNRPGPLARINCAALTESLLESELFGYEKGAFTGAATAKVGLLEGADGGTVFLDEVGELPLTVQAKLLRAVERREVLRVGAIRPKEIDVRFVAATNRDLPVESEAGRFRRDLFYRLEEVTLIIPPLRERRGMIGRLALHFLREVGRESGRPATLATEALAALEAHPWPGNVRELRSVIARAALLARGGEIGLRHLGLARRATTAEPPAAAVEAAPAPAPAGGRHGLDDEQRADRDRVVAALDACAGNQTRAARMLGIGRTTLLKKLGLYGISRPRK
jgi:two-component system, NtrC family, response regulator AtoC